MLWGFDYNGKYEYPILTLADPDFEEIGILEHATNLIITPRFNAVSEMTFTLYETYSDVDGTTHKLPYYDQVSKNRLVKVYDLGWFVIMSSSEFTDGGTPYKNINCYSYEFTLNYKGINVLDGTRKFWDPFDSSETWLYLLTKDLYNWSIGHVDTELWNLYRTFEIPESTLYGFLHDDFSKTFDCIIVFDINNLTINAYKPNNLVRPTDVVFTFDNVNKSVEIKELDTDIYTILRVNGAENLTIAIVNPIGTNRIYTFDYYVDNGWIKDQALVTKIRSWYDLIDSNTAIYNQYIDDLMNYTKDMIVLKAALKDLNNELDALEIVRKNLATVDPAQFYIVTQQVNAKVLEINAKQAEIDVKQTQIDNTNTALANINNLLGFTNYFTEDEIKILDPFLIESVYTDENFIVTDEMIFNVTMDSDSLVLTTTGTKKIGDLLPNDIIIDAYYIANQLFDQAKEIAKKVAQPSYEFTLDAENFLFIEKYLPFTQQVELGYQVNIEVKEGEWVYPVILEMTIDYDNPTNFKMVFGNRFRLSDDAWTWDDLYAETSKTVSKVGTTLGVVSEPILNGTVSGMYNQINSNFIAANNQVQSTEDNEVTMGGFGLRLRKKNSNYPSGYDPRQTWLNDNTIIMTDDNWDTVKLAIGYINGYYSVNAEIIAGYLLAGNQLIIQDGIPGNESTFIVDANGVRITNGSITMTTNYNRIYLNPSTGISIQRLNNGVWTNVFYVDGTGNLHTAAGYIGNFIIDTTSIRSTNGLLTLAYDGTVNMQAGYIAGLQIHPYQLGDADGNFYADQSAGSGKAGPFSWFRNTQGRLDAIFAVDDISFSGGNAATNYATTMRFYSNNSQTGSIQALGSTSDQRTFSIYGSNSVRIGAELGSMTMQSYGTFLIETIGYNNLVLQSMQDILITPNRDLTIGGQYTNIYADQQVYINGNWSIELTANEVTIWNPYFPNGFSASPMATVEADYADASFWDINMNGNMNVAGHSLGLLEIELEDGRKIRVLGAIE